MTAISEVAAGALAVFSVAPGADARAVAERMDTRARRGERSAAIIVGNADQRAAAERALRAGGWVEMSSIVHVAALDQPGEREVRRGVLRALGSREVVAAARNNPALRDEARRRVVGRSARTAAVLASGAFGGAAGMVALSVAQVRMLGDLAALGGRNLGREDAADIAAVAGSGLAWRVVGRSAVRWSGRPELARGGVAYLATRAIGVAARARLGRTGGVGAGQGAAALKERARGLAQRTSQLRQGRKS